MQSGAGGDCRQSVNVPVAPKLVFEPRRTRYAVKGVTLITVFAVAPVPQAIDVPAGQAPEKTSHTRSVAVPNVVDNKTLVFGPELKEYHTFGHAPSVSQVGVGPSCVALAVVPVTAEAGQLPFVPTVMAVAFAHALLAGGGVAGLVTQIVKVVDAGTPVK